MQTKYLPWPGFIFHRIGLSTGPDFSATLPIPWTGKILEGPESILPEMTKKLGDKSFVPMNKFCGLPSN